MAKSKKLLWLGIVAFVVFLIAAQGPLGVLLGLPGNVDIFVKDSNGNAISGARCAICTVPINCGFTSKSAYDTSNSAGRCSFTGLASGDMYPWDVACTSGSTIHKSGSVEIFPPMFGFPQTSDVYVTLSGCTSSTPSTTTTTMLHCESHASYNCYLGDVYYYNSCGNRQDIKQSCGTFGCQNGACLQAPTPSPTTTIPGATTTTLPASCIDKCDAVGCNTDENGLGFRCAVQANGCRSWVQDSTCNASNNTMLMVAAVAGLIALMLLVLYFKKRK